MGAIPAALKDEHRYPLDPLLEAMGIRRCGPACDPHFCWRHMPVKEIARRVGVGESRLYDMLRDGLTEKMADRLACRNVSGPVEVWPEWTTNAPDFARGQRVAVVDPADPYCGREGTVCRRQDGFADDPDRLAVSVDGVGKKLRFLPDQLEPLDPLEGVEALR